MFTAAIATDLLFFGFDGFGGFYDHDHFPIGLHTSNLPRIRPTLKRQRIDLSGTPLHTDAMRMLVILLIALLPAGSAMAQRLGMSITESSMGDYDADVNQALRAGIEFASLTVFWDEAEQNGTYAADPDWPAIANSYYPGKGLGLVLSLPVIDTVTDRRPENLRALPFDDPQVLARFEPYLRAVLERLQDTDLVAISIGNEVDGVLQTAQEWQEFARFFAGARLRVKALRPQTPVGFTTTWGGMQGPYALAANAASDALFINYYPLDAGYHVIAPTDISNQLDRMIALAGDKPVFLTETGYPSGGCGSSEAMQKEYLQQLFAALESRRAEIPLVELVWLHDVGDQATDYYGQYYGESNPCFLSYLRTLGLRSFDNHDKPAFEWLVNR